MAPHSCSRLVLAAAVALAAPVAMAQSAASSPAPGASGSHATRVAHADASFLKQAAENGNAEVESSKLALTKATNDKVKAFAQQMIDDHTKAGNELKALATSKGVEVSSEPSLMQQGKLKLLSTADGAKFDQKYADEMGVKAHEDTVKLFEKASREAKDPEVKAWAAKTLPTLKTHLEHARTLKVAVGKS
jgi:putative membrane protein